tara:strand:- start:200 stop:430 length:231 start_codon:yes stop_codon:yes gene_type:complete
MIDQPINARVLGNDRPFTILLRRFRYNDRAIPTYCKPGVVGNDTQKSSVSNDALDGPFARIEVANQIRFQDDTTAL